MNAPVSLPLTPKPTSVSRVGKALINLNGTWEFTASPGSPSRPIQVPGEWAMQGFQVPDRGWGTYHRTIDIPQDWQNHPVRIRFDAVHAVCRVLLNGVEIGTHEGGFVPFIVDATRAIKPGQNDLLVQVQCGSLTELISCISQYASHQVGGIVRKVEMFALPQEAHVESLATHTILSDSGADLNGVIRIASTREGPLKLDITIRDSQNRIAAQRTASVEAGDSQFSIAVPAPALWTPETPHLYSLEINLLANGKRLENVKRKIGLREIKIEGNRLLVNGRPVKLLGVNRHEVHPLRGRSLTPALCRQDVELFRRANVNVIRTSHYPPSEEFLEACDELGMFVECEAAVCWVGHGASPKWQELDRNAPEMAERLIQPSQDMIAAYREHPSILQWSLANESVWSPHFALAYRRAKLADPSRPVSFHDQCWGSYNNAGNTTDIANYHYPSEANTHMWSELPRPVWFGEYAHLQCYNRFELTTDPWLREDWGRPLQRMVDLIWSQPGCVGGCIWSGIDDVFHMPNGDLKGYGHWGPIDGWRREKPEYLGVKNAYSPLRILRVHKSGSESTTLTVQNRFNFLDLSQVALRWEARGRQGKVNANLGPHETGDIKMNHPALSNGEALTLTLTDARGLELVREVFYPVGKPDSQLPWKGTPLAFTEVGIQTKGWQIPYPIPMVLPLNAEGGTSTEAGTKLANQIDAYTPVCDSWKATISQERSAILLHGRAEEVEGTIRLEQRDDRIRIDYDLKMRKDINPRQWGLVFDLDRRMNNISWDRKAHWSYFPEESIGRPTGAAKADPAENNLVEQVGAKPSGPWRLDRALLGSNDFRATKEHIHWAALEGAGRGLLVSSPDNSASVRAWVQGNRVRLLVAGFNTGGSDHFFGTHYSAERRPLKAGDQIKGQFEMALR